MTAQALGAQYHFGRKGQGPMMPGMHMLPQPNAYRSIFRHPDGTYDWETELDYGWSLIDAASCGSLAACIIEPIQSSAGIHVLPTGYLAALKSHCSQRNMLLIVDEAQTGIGRAGHISASCHHDGVTPDIITFSKTLGNGLPLSAVVTSHEIDKVCKSRGFCFFTTHVNDPLPAAVGDKVLEIVERDNLVEHSRKMGEILHQGLQRLKARYACIGDVRGRGLMAGLEIIQVPTHSHPQSQSQSQTGIAKASCRETRPPDLELSTKLARKMYDLGLWANLSSHASFGGVFRIAPPIVITEEEIRTGLGIMDRAFGDVLGS
jgi:4-aminobutyrate aminotransferase-like enzyme